MEIRLSITLVVYFSYFVGAANILLLEEVPSPSHHIWFKTIVAELAARGYNVTVVCADEEESSDNIHYIHMDKVFETLYAAATEDNFFGTENKGIGSQLLDSAKFSLSICMGYLKSSGWELLSNYPDDFKFDLIVHDYIMSDSCLLSFAKKFPSVPVISMTAFNDNAMMPFAAKSSLIPALNPHPVFKTFPLTFTNRVSNVLTHLIDKILYSWHVVPGIISMVQSVAHFDSGESTSKSILYLTNYHAAVDGPQQMPTNAIGVAGLHIRDPQPLPEYLQNIIENSSDGLVLFSLGNNVGSQLLDETVTEILEVFSQFPNHLFLWKTDLERYPVPLPQNVFVRNFLPQNDILAQNNTKLFITHGGLLSTQEAIWHGVPMLGIPLFADQFSNIYKAVEKGIAECLHFDDWSKEIFYQKLLSMLTSTKYEANMEILSKSFKDQKEKPMERAIWWIEWAIRNPNVSHLVTGNGKYLNFLQIESIDVYAFLTIICSVVVWIQLWICYKIGKFIFFRKSANVTKSPKPIVSGKKKRK